MLSKQMSVGENGPSLIQMSDDVLSDPQDWDPLMNLVELTSTRD